MGAEVTAISKNVFRTLSRIEIRPPNRALYGRNRKPLSVLGQFEETLAHSDQTSLQTVFVVKGLRNNLLGLPTIQALHLVSRINEIASHSEVKRTFPRLFTGLCNLGDPYWIQLHPNSKPFALYTPQQVPLPLRTKVKEELNRMELLKVISKVNETTSWCAGLVVVPKKTGQVRISVDLKPLNKSVMRELHALPMVDETLGQLTGAAAFSKLDANSGF